MQSKSFVCSFLFILIFSSMNLLGQNERFNGLNMNMGNLYRLSDAETRSISPENFTGEKGKGWDGVNMLISIRLPFVSIREAHSIVTGRCLFGRNVGLRWKICHLYYPLQRTRAGNTR